MQDLPALNISVRKIYLSNLSINNRIQLKENEEMDVNIGQETIFMPPMELGQFEISFAYAHKQTKENILAMKVVTEFHLAGLLEYTQKNIKNNQPNVLPRDFLITCLSLSLSHSRVYLYQSIAPTHLKNVIPLPVFNPAYLATLLYKEDINLDVYEDDAPKKANMKQKKKASE